MEGPTRVSTQIINWLNSIIVSVYKTVGLGILVLILLGLLAYFTLQAFYLVNRSWLAPVILSPSHEKVVALNAQFVQQTQSRDLLDAQRLELEARLADADRIVSTQERFLAAYSVAVENERAATATELAEIEKLGLEAETVQREVDSTRRAYVDLARKDLGELFSSRIIDKEVFIGRNFMLAQTAQSKLESAKGHHALRSEKERLQRRSRAISQAARRGPDQVSIPRHVVDYDVLVMEYQRAQALLELERARDSREAIRRGLEAIREAMTGYDRILDAIRNSPYLRALDSPVTIAFVPYENLKNCGKDVEVYGCHLGLLWCEKVGTVVGLLEGEVSVKHPRTNENLRGQMIELNLAGGPWSEKPVLHARRPPFLL